MLNLEIKGMIGSVDVILDKKSGNKPAMSIALMTEKGKLFKAKVRSLDDTVQSFQHGQGVALRFEEVDMLMNDYGNMNISCDIVKILGAVKAQAAAPGSSPLKAANQ